MTEMQKPIEWQVLRSPDLATAARAVCRCQLCYI